MGWRMGGGEDYYNEFYRMFLALSVAEQGTYTLADPEPGGWSRFYAMIRSNPQL